MTENYVARNCPGFGREGDVSVGKEKCGEDSSGLTKVWNCLKLLLTKVSKLDSRGFKELPTVCAAGVDWVVIVCFLLKMSFSQPPFCGGAACLKIVTGR